MKSDKYSRFHFIDENKEFMLNFVRYYYSIDNADINFQKLNIQFICDLIEDLEFPENHYFIQFFVPVILELITVKAKQIQKNEKYSFNFQVKLLKPLEKLLRKNHSYFIINMILSSCIMNVLIDILINDDNYDDNNNNNGHIINNDDGGDDAGYCIHDHSSENTNVILSILGMISLGNSIQTFEVLHYSSLFPKLIHILYSNSKSCVIKVLWLISNFAISDNPQQIEILFQKQIISCIIDLLNQFLDCKRKYSVDVVRELYWSIANIFQSGDVLHIQHLIEKYKFLEITCILFSNYALRDPTLLHLILTVLLKIYVRSNNDDKKSFTEFIYSTATVVPTFEKLIKSPVYANFHSQLNSVLQLILNHDPDYHQRGNEEL